MLDIEQFKEMNNKLAVPAYRQFCRDNDLKFHFWDKLPETPATLNQMKIMERERVFHKEAMDLFNRLKPEYHLFQDHVVSFRLTSWAGDISHETKHVEEFMRDHAELREQAKWQETKIDVLEGIIFVLLILVYIGFNKYLSAIPFWVIFPGGIFLGWGLHEWMQRRPKKLREREIDKAQQQLTSLRVKLNQAWSDSKLVSTSVA